MAEGQYDCSELSYNIHLLEADPDVSGKGVLTAILFPAFSTFVLLATKFIFVETTSANPIDRGLSKFFSSFNWVKDKERKNIEIFLDKVILQFSDQQIITGIAILASGFAQLKGNISAYHWQIVVYTAWFCSFTHLATLIGLRFYFQHNTRTHIVRLTLMSLLVIALAVALGPTGNYLWPIKDQEEIEGFGLGTLLGPWLHQKLLAGELFLGKSKTALDSGASYNKTFGGNEDSNSTEIPDFLGLGTPARCFFTGDLPDFTHFGRNRNLDNLIISMSFLVVSYFTRIIKLSSHRSRLVRSLLREKTASVFERMLDWMARRAGRPGAWRVTLVAYELSLASFLLCRALFDYSQSMLWEILWLSYGLTWGSVQLFYTRALPSTKKLWADEIAENFAEKEAQWPFGQVMAITLATLPLLSVYELYNDVIHAPRKILQSDVEDDEKAKRPPLKAHNLAAKGASSQEDALPRRRITRTGTDLMNEEHNIESRSVPLEDLPPLPTSDSQDTLASHKSERTGAGHASPEGTNSSTFLPRTPGYHNRDFYETRWYKLLFVMLTLYTIEAVPYIIWASIQQFSVVTIVVLAVLWGSAFLLSGFFYTVFFLMLEDLADKPGFISRHLGGQFPKLYEFLLDKGPPLFLVLFAIATPVMQYVIGAIAAPFPFLGLALVTIIIGFI